MTVAGYLRPVAGRGIKFAVLIIVWGLTAVYVMRFVDRGWIPHDEGCLAHSAERVMSGELPHRDFDEVYTGGLSYLHALGFQVFGIKLISLRYVLLIFLLLFAPAFYALCLRVASPIAAGLVTLAAVAWSLPNYFAGVPSWYNLFFSTFGMLALVRHLETRRTRWLFVAGLFGALSFLVKVVGLYFVVAVLLFLLYEEQRMSRGAEGATAAPSGSLLLPKVLASLLLVVALVFGVRAGDAPLEVLNFVLPCLAVCGLLVWSEAKEGGGNPRARLRALFGLMMPFLAGFLTPIVLFLVPYLLSNSLDDFGRGVFVLPQKRLGNASRNLPAAATMLMALPYAVLLAYRSRGIRRSAECVAALALAVLLGYFLFASGDPKIYQGLWHSGRSLSVLAVLAGCLFAARSASAGSVSGSPVLEMLFLFLCVTALLGLVQFPFAAPVYFCYVAPLVALTVLALVNAQPVAPKLLHLCVLLFYLAFALIRLNPGYVFSLGDRHIPYKPGGTLDLDRGGLRVPSEEEREYEALVRLVRQHGAGKPLYAAPDCPEVYFLSGLRNPTRTVFDFLGEAEDRPAALMALLEREGVESVVLNRAAHFSRPIEPEFASLLESRFPRSESIGRFLVRWRR